MDIASENTQTAANIPINEEVQSVAQPQDPFERMRRIFFIAVSTLIILIPYAIAILFIFFIFALLFIYLILPIFI